MSDQPKRIRASLRPKNEFPDEIIHFRLNPGNEDEKRAIAILHKWLNVVDERGKVYSPRYVLTQALLGLESTVVVDPVQSVKDLGERIDLRFDDIRDLIEQLQTMGFAQVASPKPTSKLPKKFLSNLAQAFSPDEANDVHYEPIDEA